VYNNNNNNIIKLVQHSSHRVPIVLQHCGNQYQANKNIASCKH